MKKFLLCLAVIFSSFLFINCIAEAKFPSYYYRSSYKCRASSRYAVGFGYGYSKRVASRRALYSCSRRTPYRFGFCRINWCVRWR